jgi:hypothetical protein
MKIYEFIGLAILAEITLVLSRFVTGETLAMQMSDIPTLVAVLFGASPYGRMCYDWTRERVRRLLGRKS